MKYLGPESKKQATSIKCACSHNPEEALKRIWCRMEDRYGSPVLVETALKRRLTNFCEITNNDLKRLYDLADLLTEIQARLEDPIHHRSLCYYDSPGGMRSIVCKLPYNIQDKWTNLASNYDKRHRTYPPFSALVEFVHEMSRIRNDPSFVYEVPQKDSSGSKHQSAHTKNSMDVKKTLVNQSSVSGDKCVLHNSDHTPNQCRALRKLTIKEGKKLLKDYNFCFKCCETTLHTYKDCTNIV